MTKKCFSECRKKNQTECEKMDKCYFINGKTRKYCRLKNKYRMDTDCSISRKNINSPIIKPITKKIKIKIKIKKPIKETARTDEKDSQIKRIKAVKTIQRFMNRTKHKRKAEFLKTLCSDSGACIAFGTYANEIKKHFGGFTHFEYAVSPIKRIGVPSINGFVHEIPYLHRGYSAYAVLKSSIEPDSDNLLYEYNVGQYINKLNKQFPCFLETYGYYTYNDAKTWLFMKHNNTITNTGILKNGLSLHKTINYKVGCKQSKYLSILIQHLKGIKPIKSLLSDDKFVKEDLIQSLCQVYIPLRSVKNNYTHYDLHQDNMNLYEPVKDSYIHFHYNDFYGKTISFKSKYIAKIIDYGRSYFKDDESGINSKDIYEEICKIKECDPNCGQGSGFGWLTDVYNRENYWINSQRNNKSHDLILLARVILITKMAKTNKNMDKKLKKMLKKLKYDIELGTPEMPNGYPARLYSVDDAAAMLVDLLMDPAIIEDNERAYANKTKLGDLHVYNDGRPMRFVKA